MFLSLSPKENPSSLRNSKLSFLLGEICLFEHRLEGIGGGMGVLIEGGLLGASCRALVRHSVGTLRIDFLLARVFLGMITMETRNRILEIKFYEGRSIFEEP